MKKMFLKFHLVAFLFAMSGKAFCQDPSAVITVDMDKNNRFFVDVGLIPQGQKISLIGTSGNTVFKKIQVESTTSNGKQTFDAIITDTDWKVVIGPFQPRQLITLTIKATKIVEAKDMKKFTDILTEELGNTISEVNNDFEKSSNGLTSSELKNSFFTNLKENLGSHIDNYYLGNNQKVIDNLEDIIPCSLPDNNSFCLRLFNAVDNYKSAIEAIDSLKKLEVSKEQSRMIDASTDQKKIALDNLEQLQKDIISKIKFEEISSVIPLSSIELKASGVEFYASFDISAITFDKTIGSTALYFIVSPYVFGKFDPELDYSDIKIHENDGMSQEMKDKICKQNKRLWFKYHISPTVGIAFSGNANVPNSPQLFAGLSFRLNRLFKITTGSVFYKNPQNDNYIHNLSFGMSISLNYFGTVLQMLGNATRSVNSTN